MLDPSDALKAINREPLEITANKDTSLPAITKLKVDVTDGRGKKYVGEFTFKVPTLGDQVQIGRLKTVYLPSGSPADTNAALIVEAICYLEVTLQGDKPSWWKPFEMYDITPVSALYQEALSYERRFLGGDQDGAGNAEEPSSEGESVGTGKPAVGRKVQPSSKRREVLVGESEGTD